MKKKITIVTLGIFCTFLVIALSLFQYVKTDHAKNLLVNKINTIIPGTLFAENIEFSLIKSSVKLNAIKIKTNQNKTCLKFKSLFVDLKISSLFKKVVEVTLLTMDSPQLSLVMDKNGRTDLMDALIPRDITPSGKKVHTKKSKGIPFNVVVKKARIIEGALIFNAPGTCIDLKSLKYIV